MIEMIVMYLDEDGIPRAFASGLIKNNKDLDVLKNTALEMLGKYIENKSCSINDFTLQVEFVD